MVRGTFHWVFATATRGLSTPAVYAAFDRLVEGRIVPEPEADAAVIAALIAGRRPSAGARAAQRPPGAGADAAADPARRARRGTCGRGPRRDRVRLRADGGVPGGGPRRGRAGPRRAVRAGAGAGGVHDDGAGAGARVIRRSA